jgi:hypothetical protein
MIRRMFQRRGTEAEWLAANPVLGEGEIGIELHEGESPAGRAKWKVGDGETPWVWLPYMGALPDGDYGDITVSNDGRTVTVDNNAITYAKLQDVAANSVLARAAGTDGDVSAVALAASQLLGRGATGDVAPIVLGTGLSMTGATLNASGGGSGDVVGPASSVNNNVAFFDGTTGKLLKDSGLALSGTNTGNETATSIATILHAATSKATPVDADELPLIDSAASYGLKKLTWANLKATAKAYFDTLYAAIGLITGSGLTSSATSRVIGRKSASGGALEELTLSDVLDLIGPAAQGDILYRDASGWARLGAGTLGQALVTGGTGANPAWGTVGSGAGGAMTYIGSATVTGAAATTLSISGLNLDVDTRYEISFEGANATGSATTLSLYFNSDTTATNYDVESVGFAGATTTPARANSSVFGQMAATSGTASVDMILTKGQDGKPSARIVAREDITTAIRLRSCSQMWRTSGTNVTGITITASVANSLAIGSIIRVWKTTP